VEDGQILELYFARSEQAIQETDAKYGGYCYSIAYNILTNREDAEESVSDTYMAAWKAIPPKRPGVFSAFLGRITRYISIDRWRKYRSQKRGGGEMTLALEELSECVSPAGGPEERLRKKELEAALNRFLGSLPELERDVLLCRYWYMDGIAQIAERSEISESKVKSMLHRLRGRLRAYLQKEGFV